MSFSGDDKATLSEILRVTPFTLQIHLDSVESALSAETEDKIKADIALWVDYRDDFSYIEGNLKNFGAYDNPGNNRNAIRQRIANWLELDIGVGAGSKLIRA